MNKSYARYLDELLLYSGQYALFYVLMNFNKDGLNFFNYSGHMLMLFGLLVQILYLANWGGKPLSRLLGSLICPGLYTMFEAHEIMPFISNMGHFFFWVFSLLIGLLNAVNLKAKGSYKDWLEAMIVFMNVIMFLFVYMYFDAFIKLNETTVASGAAMNEYDSRLSIFYLGENLSLFFKDKTHWYLMMGGALLGVSLSIGKFRLNRLNETIRVLFGTYLDPVIRDKVMAAGGALEENKKLAVLFCDIRGFTTLSEAHGHGATIQMLNHYFTLWEQMASEQGGVINKYIGDAVMILFGLSADGEENAARDAVRCVQSFRENFDALNQQLEALSLPTIQAIGVGIHYGDVVLGNVGSARRREFTAIGDTVNTASRLESATKEMVEAQPVSLIISDAIYRQLPDNERHVFAAYERLLLKGKQQWIETYNFLDFTYS